MNPTTEADSNIRTHILGSCLLGAITSYGAGYMPNGYGAVWLSVGRAVGNKIAVGNNSVN
jgi:hypothetical protein